MSGFSTFLGKRITDEEAASSGTPAMESAKAKNEKSTAAVKPKPYNWTFLLQVVLICSICVCIFAVAGLSMAMVKILSVIEVTKDGSLKVNGNTIRTESSDLLVTPGGTLTQRNTSSPVRVGHKIVTLVGVDTVGLPSGASLSSDPMYVIYGLRWQQNTRARREDLEDIADVAAHESADIFIVEQLGAAQVTRRGRLDMAVKTGMDIMAVVTVYTVKSESYQMVLQCSQSNATNTTQSQLCNVYTKSNDDIKDMTDLDIQNNTITSPRGTVTDSTWAGLVQNFNGRRKMLQIHDPANAYVVTRSCWNECGWGNWQNNCSWDQWQWDGYRQTWWCPYLIKYYTCHQRCG